MSALPLKANICGATRDVRYGPEADMTQRLHFINSNRQVAQVTVSQN